ncbi:hypothetical protein OESDEN_17613 [Oesophagostomum dentatum]|uniref:SCP domain-containing protein n=1 Tax=Oesophagostomum dentatum TaxID=61180 RepID=A0A0B1SGQ3_OESDE|nr:hypothetical protein OESDEN_17613 [Oesophagostomum dentatum]
MAVARIVLSVVALLSVAAYTGAATSCENSTLEESEVEAALSVINEARSKVYHGEQLNGESGEKLPAAAKVTTVEWDCSLEEVALQDMKDRCNKKKPNVQANLTYVRRR